MLCIYVNIWPCTGNILLYILIKMLLPEALSRHNAKIILYNLQHTEYKVYKIAWYTNVWVGQVKITQRMCQNVIYYLGPQKWNLITTGTNLFTFHFNGENKTRTTHLNIKSVSIHHVCVVNIISKLNYLYPI